MCVSEQCVLGYCLFPLLGAAVISMFLHNLLIRLPVSLAAWAWSVWGEQYLFLRRNRRAELTHTFYKLP